MEAVYDYPIVPQPREQANEQEPEYMEIVPEPSTSGKVSQKQPSTSGKVSQNKPSTSGKVSQNKPSTSGKVSQKQPSTSGNVSQKHKVSKDDLKWAPFIILIVIKCAIVLLLLTVLLLIATQYTINKNNSSDAATYVTQQLNTQFAQSKRSIDLIQKMKENTKKLTKISESLSNLNSTSTSTADTINAVLVTVKELLLIHN